MYFGTRMLFIAYQIPAVIYFICSVCPRKHY